MYWYPSSIGFLLPIMTDSLLAPGQEVLSKQDHTEQDVAPLLLCQDRPQARGARSAFQDRKNGFYAHILHPMIPPPPCPAPPPHRANHQGLLPTPPPPVSSGHMFLKNTVRIPSVRRTGVRRAW